MNRRRFGVLSLAALAALAARGGGDDKKAALKLTLRARVKEPNKDKEAFTVTEKKAEWDPKKTALVICDMWDAHWCKSAAGRVEEMSEPLDAMVKTARK